MQFTKPAAATVSIFSNSLLIALKLAAGAITGSIAILTEALHSGIDLMASLIAYISVIKADEPADAEHPYGHQKVESVAASIEGMLILVGAGVVVFEATRRLAGNADLESLGVGIAVIAFSAVANACVAWFLRRQAKDHESPALAADAAHLGTDALTSLGVLAGLILVQATGVEAFDSIAALAVAAAIVVAGVRILGASAGALVDVSPPPEEMDDVERVLADATHGEVVGYHKLRGRISGHRRYVDLHLQFRSGTSLEQAHKRAHQLRDEIVAVLGDAEVLIHVEPEASRRDPASSPENYRAG